MAQYAKCLDTVGQLQLAMQAVCATAMNTLAKNLNEINDLAHG
jgi:hypothetical protein